MDDYKIPATDKEAEAALASTYSDDLVRRCVIGLYRCDRGEGKTVAESFRGALETYLRIAEGKGEAPRG